MWYSIIKSPIITILAAGLLVFLGFVVAGRLPLLRSLDRELSRAEDSLEEAREAKRELDEKKNFMQGEEYLERQARVQLNYKDPEESVVYVYRRGEVSGKKEDAGKPLSNLRLWFEYLVK